jgi:hypothetical protein
MRRPRLVATVSALVALPVGGTETIVSFRNGGTGVYPEADPPREWSVTRNVRWRWV